MRRDDEFGTDGLWREGGWQRYTILYAELACAWLLTHVHSVGPHAAVAWGHYPGAFYSMKLIAFYVGFVVIGEAVAYVIGRTVEHLSQTMSLPVFLACFFFTFWGAWRLAVRLT
jgi:hypothetical protein